MIDDNASLDMSTLDELREMLEEGLDELLTEYLADTQHQLTQLRQVADSNNMAAIATISHTLKGSSGNLGVSSMYALCQVLEQEAKCGVVADMAASLGALEDAFNKAKKELAVFMAG